MIRRLFAGCALCLSVGTAHGDGLVGGAMPRAIGRAGTGTVGDDGGGALLLDPAALARRETTRVQLGIGARLNLPHGGALADDRGRHRTEAKVEGAEVVLGHPSGEAKDGG
ncbi:MAG: hypothetical protein NT062_24180, partial [Proteobacteria bacterium]|nr:hypothetical protein [Pseudomonadota bacterium]